ncbi:hypothetical protein WMF31_38235 [Sorangium sp. So ce1036]|uniref:hypothetical protein n=1 Tax=Sorangium sp. So ce1036 TaxID=3133328 RepID=UPI003F0659B9
MVLSTLLLPVLLVMPIPEMGRRVIHGVANITIVLVYGRRRWHSDWRRTTRWSSS